ncbi:class I SAM-dependent methyltransferase [Hymenobacter psychrotolerans]|uniref:Methyltransferase domain-containing protein n=1 Tax=Hymenobacter psychrotolerans DSM 18569 TaxID=1121959 RepID=A0A1M7E159_9BACT|nr:class I SAM-dependent methyltransferase [Hymenobacter psychrotolerans]SHL85348.1 Methyltransferase domain-containing protein [Hymenobacter psychrotolerans DSM 18569]
MSATTSAPADPMGHALLDYHRGRLDASLTVHSNVAEEEPLPAAYLFRSLWEMPELERQALDECRGRVLDLGAGAGCHALELQSRGLQVKAIDISAGAAQVMQERGVREVASHDIFDAALTHEKYDTLLMLMNGIGLVGTLEGLAKFLRHARTLLAPGGQILATSSDISYLYEDEDGALVFDLNGPYYGEVTYTIQYGEQHGAEFPWLFADASIVQDYAEEAGYEVEFLGEDEQQQFLVRLTPLMERDA